jgi:predicted flap endonuclease-1-like 5' DNA nuclease/cytoskeletal protein CcmA (bactofilin family)
MLRTNRRWLLAATLILLLSLLAVFAVDAKAGVAAPPANAGPTNPEGQIFNENLVVEKGDVYDRDVIVYSGDVTVKDGGLIRGNLVVYKGDVDIREGGVVEGDLSAFSGDVKLAGRVGGNLVAWSGDIDLRDSAQVDGDVSVVSGDVEQARGASVGGEIVRGPTIKLPGAFSPFSFQPDQAVTAVDNAVTSGPGFLGWFGRMIGRTFSAAMFLLLVGALAAGVAFVKPTLVEGVTRTAQEKTALSFATGLAANFALTILAVVLIITICLWPFPLILLTVLNIIGFAGMGNIVGRYLTDWLGFDLHPALAAGLGAALLVGLFAPFWVLGGCFRFIAWLGLMAMGTVGTGALILPWLGDKRNGAAATSTSVPASASSAPQPGPEAMAEDMTVTVHTPQQPPAAAVVDVQPARPEKPGVDDLTRIDGIGPVFAQRLNAAGVRTFAQLAALTPEQIADIIGWPAERVIRSRIIEQAREL